jgi:hypothetical protein
VYPFFSSFLLNCLNGDNYCYLWSNICLFFQNKLVQLLEIALADGMDKVSDLLQPSSVNSLIDLLPMVADYCVDIDLHNHSKCSLQGIYCCQLTISCGHVIL